MKSFFGFGPTHGFLFQWLLTTIALSICGESETDFDKKAFTARLRQVEGCVTPLGDMALFEQAPPVCCHATACLEGSLHVAGFSPVLYSKALLLLRKQLFEKHEKKEQSNMEETLWVAFC